MLLTALRSKDDIAIFVTGILINLLYFLGSATFLSATAIAIWIGAFITDIVRMHLLRRNQCKVSDTKLQHFKIQDHGDFGPPISELQDTIWLYLTHKDATAEWVAETIDAMLPANQYLRLPEVYVRRSSIFARRLWLTLGLFACQIPANDIKQEQLVELIVALSKRPAVLVRTEHGLLRFWDGMPEYCFLTLLHGASAFAPTQDQETLAGQNNLMAFFARVQATGLPAMAGNGYDVSFPAALERGELDKLQWAAYWIQYCGEYLWWKYALRPEWHLWMDQFYKIATNPQNTLQTRLLAHDSFLTMKRLTGSRPDFTKFDNMGQERWLHELGDKGPHGDFTEPIAPDDWDEEHEMGEDSEYESNWGSNEEEEEEDRFDPLLPPGGFLPFASVTGQTGDQIARAA